MHKYLRLSAVLFSAFLNVAVQSKPDSTANDLNAYFKTVKWRNIGPFRGGRSVAASGVVDDMHTYSMGTTGGLFVSTNAGKKWSFVSNDQ